MGDIVAHIISGIIGFLIGKFGDLVINKAMKKKKEIAKQSLTALNILERYEKEVLPIISYGDIEAIKINPIRQYGKILLRANINIEKFPNDGKRREFVMALLKYIPSSDWKDYSSLNYSFSFKARGSIRGLQLEIKNSLGQKLIDEFIGLKNEFKEYSFKLTNESIWGDVSEICFTIFCENKYITGNSGIFEIMDCYLL